LDVVFPLHHEMAAWGPTGLIAYRDNGIVSVDGGGGYHVDPELAGIWVLNPDTGERWRVNDFGHMPTWSPDGSTVAFVTSDHVFSIASDGTGLIQLADSDRWWFPDWSPDGQSLAWCTTVGDNRGVFTSTLSGDGIVKRLSYADYPDWHPEGRYIICDGWFGRGEVIGVLDTHAAVDSATVIWAVPGEHGEARAPKYSPSGSHVAFAYQSVGFPQIWVMQDDGSRARQVTSLGGCDPSWSPDGTRIVYTRDDRTNDAPENGVLWCVDVITGAQEQLTHKWSAEDRGAGLLSCRSN